MKYFERLKIAASAVDVLKKYGIYAVLSGAGDILRGDIREFLPVQQSA